MSKVKALKLNEIETALSELNKLCQPSIKSTSKNC